MATTVNTLETNTEVFKGDRVVADGVERSLGDVATSGVSYEFASVTGTMALSNNNLTVANSSGTWSIAHSQAIGTGADFDFSFHVDNVDSYVNGQIGIANVNNLLANPTPANNLICYIPDGRIAHGSGVYTGGYATYTTNDTIRIRYFASSNTFEFLKNDVPIYSQVLTTAGSYYIYYTTAAVSGITASMGTTIYSADFNTPLASIPTSVYRLDHDNLTILRQSNDSLLDDANQIAHYKFDGDATDRKGTYDGTATNVTYGTGKFGTAVVGGSSSKSIVIPTIALSGDFSISFFSKVTSTNLQRAFSQNTASRDWISVYNGGHNLEVRLGDVNYSAAYTNTNDWMHFTVVRSGTNLTTRVNGTLVGNHTVGTMDYITNNLLLDSWDNLYAIDSLDQVRIFDRALTATEVEALYTEGLPTATTATVLDSRTGLIASGDTVLLDGVGVVCNPVVETEVSSLEPDGSLNTSTTDAIPVMTSNTSTGVASASTIFGVGYEAWRAMDNLDDAVAWLSQNAITTGWLQYMFTASKIINKYTIKTRNDASGPIEAPKDWTLQGSNDGTSWVILDTVAGQTGWVVSTARVFTCVNNTAYLYYKIDITLNNGGTAVSIGEMELIEVVNDATAYQYDLTYPAQTAPTRIALSGNDIIPTVASDTFDGTDTFTKTYNTVTKTARDVEYGFVADTDVEIVQVNINQNKDG